MQIEKIACIKDGDLGTHLTCYINNWPGNLFGFGTCTLFSFIIECSWYRYSKIISWGILIAQLTWDTPCQPPLNVCMPLLPLNISFKVCETINFNFFILASWFSISDLRKGWIEILSQRPPSYVDSKLSDLTNEEKERNWIFYLIGHYVLVWQRIMGSAFEVMFTAPNHWRRSL